MFFSGYGRGKRPVRASLHEKNPWSLSSHRAGDPKAEDARFNPFDLNLFAGWLSDPKADADAMHRVGKHHYVRERSHPPAQRVGAAIFVPYLAKLGDFDRELVQAIADASEEDCATVLQEIVQQEWVEHARAAQWQKESPGKPLPATWRIEPNVARRMLKYFSEAEDQKSLWSTTLERLRPIVARRVLSRPWSELSLEYFVVAFELMASTPDEALGWWREVEAKIVHDRAWSWGMEIIGAIRAREWTADSPLAPGTAPLVVWAMLGATETALQTKLRIEGSALQSSWSTVCTQLAGNIRREPSVYAIAPRPVSQARGAGSTRPCPRATYPSSNTFSIRSRPCL